MESRDDWMLFTQAVSAQIHCRKMEKNTRTQPYRDQADIIYRGVVQRLAEHYYWIQVQNEGEEPIVVGGRGNAVKLWEANITQAAKVYEDVMRKL